MAALVYACAPQPGYGPGAPGGGLAVDVDAAGAASPFAGEGLALFVEAGAHGGLRATARDGEGDADGLRLREVALTHEGAGGGLRLWAPAASVDVRGGTAELTGNVCGEFVFVRARPEAPVRGTPAPPPAPTPPAPPVPPRWPPPAPPQR